MAAEAQRTTDRSIVVYPTPGREPESSALIDPSQLPIEVVERVDATFAEAERRTDKG